MANSREVINEFLILTRTEGIIPALESAHAIAYAIDSYYAAWLHTYYEKEWLATILQSENNNPRGLEKTISEIRSYGYKFDKSDINYYKTNDYL